MEDIIIYIILGSIGITSILIGIYVKLLVKKFNDNGVKLKFKAIDCKKDENDQSTNFYNTTFEFTYKDSILKETIRTKKSFEIGKLYDGIFLPGVTYSKISIQDHNESITNGKEWLFIIGGILTLILLIVLIIL